MKSADIDPAALGFTVISLSDPCDAHQARLSALTEC